MDDDNLFLALKRYAPGPNVDPKENFLTEAFAWLLRQHEGLAEHFIQFVLGQCELDFVLPEDTPARWVTQEGDGRVWLDMVADFGDKAIVFEHKVWSQLGEGQLKKYRDYGDDVWSGGVLVVLITARRSQHAQEPDVALTWAQVHRQLARWSEREQRSHVLVEHFLGLLRAEGLGPPAPISHDAILGYFPAQQLEPSLKALVKRALAEDWSWLYARVHPTRRRAAPYLRWSRGERYRDGRMGLDLLEGWRPGFFVGVMLDGADHKVEPSAPQLGPDFCCVLSYNIKAENAPTWDDFIQGSAYRRLCARLASEGDGWDVLDHIKAHSKPNRWHPLHIRRPLLEVMRGTQTLDEQLDAFMDASREVLDLVVRGGELDAFWAKWASPVR